MKIFTKTLDKPLEFYLSKLKDHPLSIKEKFVNVNNERKYVFILNKTENELDDYARCSTGKRIYFVSMYLQENKGRNTVIIEQKVWYWWIFLFVFIFFIYLTIRSSLIMGEITFLKICVLLGFIWRLFFLDIFRSKL